MSHLNMCFSGGEKNSRKCLHTFVKKGQMSQMCFILIADLQKGKGLKSVPVGMCDYANSHKIEGISHSNFHTGKTMINSCVILDCHLQCLSIKMETQHELANSIQSRSIQPIHHHYYHSLLSQQLLDLPGTSSLGNDVFLPEMKLTMVFQLLREIHWDQPFYYWHR